MRTLLWALCPLLLVAVAGCSVPVETTSLKAVQAVYQPPVATVLETVTPIVAAVQQYLPDELPAESNAAVEAVLDEVTALRKEMASLRHELSGQIEDLVAELRKENEHLRQDVARLNTLSASSEKAGPLIPVPNERNEAEPDVVQTEPEMPDLPETKGPARPFLFTSVKEWGRSPEEVAKLATKASSLAGVVGTVPPGSSEKDLIALGRQLREKYDACENINIEVFDDADAARQFIERNTADSAHQVLSVSKHAASGRDSVLVYRNGAPIDVSTGAPRPSNKKPE